MSYVVDGKVVDTEITKNAKGGTELMRSRLITNVDKKLLENVSINFSRFEGLYEDKINIIYAHDLPQDNMYDGIFKTDVWKRVDKFVFVSHTQKEWFINKYNIPYNKISVIENAIGEDTYSFNLKNNDKIRFIYHTTPHRGLDILYYVFKELSEEYSNIELDVFSSFKVYGWEDDKSFVELFKKIGELPNARYHGAQPNEVVIDYLKKSHVFLYPCVWKETSCLALMEAIQNGCICIHPDYGALPETSRGETIMFPMKDDKNSIANMSYQYTKYVLDNFQHFSEIQSNKTIKPYSLKTFTEKWTGLLKELKNV